MRFRIRRVHVLLLILCALVAASFYLGWMLSIPPEAMTRSSMSVLQYYVMAHYRQTGAFPGGDLSVLLSQEQMGLLVDAWGRKIVYSTVDDQTIRLLSYGADGRAGGKGKNRDITIEFELRDIGTDPIMSLLYPTTPATAVTAARPTSTKAARTTTSTKSTTPQPAMLSPRPAAKRPGPARPTRPAGI